MNTRAFTAFIKEGIVKKQRPDTSRATSLQDEAQERHTFLMEVVHHLGVTDRNANYLVETAYDIIMECVRAKLAHAGYKASGVAAHEAEVSYLRELDFSERDVGFANELRYWRNGILYYGKRVDAPYAKRVLSFLEKIYPKLR